MYLFTYGCIYDLSNRNSLCVSIYENKSITGQKDTSNRKVHGLQVKGLSFIPGTTWSLYLQKAIMFPLIGIMVSQRK